VAAVGVLLSENGFELLLIGLDRRAAESKSD
jgi:hypothetical protein